jgi:glutamyl-tRNA synthetase
VLLEVSCFVSAPRLASPDDAAPPAAQNGLAYRCFCTPTELAEIKAGLRAQGSHNTYDRRGFYLTEEEVARKVKAGEKHVIRLKVRPLLLPTWHTASTPC